MHFNELLIEIVKAAPAIYDRQHEGYKDRKLKQNLWEKIGKSLGQPAMTCATRWKSLRNAFTKSLGTTKNQFWKSGKPIKPFKYSRQMSFLNQHLRAQLTANHCDYSGLATTSEEDQLNYVKLDMETVDFVWEKQESVCTNDAAPKEEFENPDVPLEGNENPLSETEEQQDDLDKMLQAVEKHTLAVKTAQSASAVRSPASSNKPDEAELFGQLIAAKIRAMGQHDAEQCMANILQCICNMHHHRT